MPLPISQDFPTLGGALQDYSPVINPLTDLSALCDNTSRATVAEMSRTADRAFVQILLSPSPHLVIWDAVWGTLVSYAPVIAHTGTGVYTVTFPASIVDALGNSIVVNLRAVTGQTVDWAGTLGFTSWKMTSANVAQLSSYNSSGSANDMAGASVTASFK